MKKKKMTAMLLTIGMVLSLIACGGGSGGVESDTDKAEEAGNAAGDGSADDVSGETNITFACWAEGAEKEFVETLIEQYNEAHDGVTVEAQFIPYAEYLSKMNILAAAGNMPEVFTMIEGNVFEWGEKGAVLDLRPLYDALGEDPYDTILDADIFDDGEHIYALGANTTTICLYYNKELLEAAGIEAPSGDASNPWSWEEFIENAQKLTTDTNGKHPMEEGFDKDNIVVYGATAPTGWVNLMALLKTNGIGFVSEDGKTLEISSEEGIEVIQAVADMSQKYYCAPTTLEVKSSFSDLNVMLMDGQIAMIISGAWSLSNYVREGFDVGVAQIPAFSQPANATWTGGICMSPDAADNAEAFEFFRFYTDYANSLQVAKENGVALGGLPHSKIVYDDAAQMQDWISTFKGIDATDICYTLKSILEHDGTRLGENVTTKNFYAIVNSSVVSALDDVWLGNADAREVLESIDVSSQLEGSWLATE